MTETDTPAPHIDSYVRMDLDTKELDPHRLEDTFTRLRSLRVEPTLEFRLVADEHVRYYIGASDGAITDVEHVLRALYPDGTTFERETPPEPPDSPTAGVTLSGRGQRHDDWQTRLRPVTNEGTTHTRLPLADLVDVLAHADATVHYQALLTPKANWKMEASLRIEQLKYNRDTPSQRFFDFLFGDYTVEATIDDANQSHQERIHSIQAAAPKQSYSAYARAVAAGTDAPSVLERLGSTLQPAKGEYYRIDPKLHLDEETVETMAADIHRGVAPEEPSILARYKRRVPGTSNAMPELVVGPETAPNLCLFDGASLTPESQRAIQSTPHEQTDLLRPDDELLTQYDTGMLLGYPLTINGDTGETPLSLPPSLQPLHAAWFGKTGSGKSTALINAMLDNHSTTDGADILIDPKGDGMPLEYLQAHYERYGSLENVYYFDCAETLPALSFFDIREQLADGIDRTTAVEDLTDHYIEMLVGIMGRDRFERAVRSPDIIRYLVKALFDPAHGAEAYSHRELQDAATRMRETRDAPPVVDPELQRMLSGVVSNSKRSFDELMQGVANRIEKIPLDDRLGQLFNYVPEDDESRFDFRDVIDEDAVVIFDTGGLRPESRRAVSLVLLSQLWNALRRRARTNSSAAADAPLVNLYLEEAATIAQSGLVSELLAQSRSFGLSMTLAMQFPGQLRQADSEAYAELLNNVSTIVSGNIAVDPDLKKRLATEDMPPAEVANRLRALERGQWFVSLPSEFGTAEPRPFRVESAPIPKGHPEHDEPPSAAKQTAFEAAFDVVRDRSRLDYGIDLALTYQQSTPTGTEPTAERDEPTAESVPESVVPSDSLLPHTKRLPDILEYDGDRHALICSSCESRYDPTREGIERSIECCHDLESVDRDDIPVCELNLKLSEDELTQSPYTGTQLRLLHAVYAAHQQRFDPELEYDLLFDSMLRLCEYVGIDSRAVDELLELGLLSKDCQYPHVLYTVTPKGRKAAKIRHREGIAHGHGAGDLSESSFHVAMVSLGERYIQTAFVEDPNSAAVEVSPYHDVEDGRLDVAGLDADGDVVVALEAERSNHDTLQAVPDDYDKMAAHEPEAAIWIVENRDGGHDVLDALYEPPNGDPRVEKSYTRSTAPHRCKIDTDGLTQMYTFTHLRDSVLE